MARSKLVQVNEKIAEGVMGGYKKIEEGVVGGFTKMTDRFVDQFLAREGESVEDAKKRLAEEQAAREEAAAEKHAIWNNRPEWRPVGIPANNTRSKNVIKWRHA